MLTRILADSRYFLAVLMIDMYGGYYVDQKQKFTLVFDCHPDLERVRAILHPLLSILMTICAVLFEPLGGRLGEQPCTLFQE